MTITVTGDGIHDIKQKLGLYHKRHAITIDFVDNGYIITCDNPDRSKYSSDIVCKTTPAAVGQYIEQVLTEWKQHTVNEARLQKALAKDRKKRTDK